MTWPKQLKETDWQAANKQALRPWHPLSFLRSSMAPHQAAAHMTARQKAGRAIAMRIRMTLLLDEVITLLVVVFQDSNHYVIKQ